MHTEMLSDRPGAMLADAVTHRQRGTAEREAVLNEAVRRRDQARAERRWLTWLRLAFYEVKYHNATFYIDGDDWQSQKYDRYGNQVGARTPMADRGGRPPGVQLSEPADALGDWLRKRGHPAAVTPVVLLTHEHARVASIRNPTVQVETSVQGLLHLIGQSPAGLDARQRAEIGQVIRDDHQHHNQRRSPPADSRRTPARRRSR